jgi:hypothetical protein
MNLGGDVFIMKVVDTSNFNDEKKGKGHHNSPQGRLFLMRIRIIISFNCQFQRPT